MKIEKSQTDHTSSFFSIGLPRHALRLTSKIFLLACALQFISISALAQTPIELPSPISGHSVTNTGITPADVLARLVVVKHEVDHIRMFMGKPQIEEGGGLLVTNTFLHENFFQILTLWQKTQRLSIEQTGQSAPDPKPVDLLQIRPFHVWTVVNTCLRQLLRVTQRLGISRTFQEQPQDDATIPTDVFRAVVDINWQMNLLLERPFSPRDVYRQVTQAIHYSARLLAQFPHVERIPHAPAFAPMKTPTDVYNRLLIGYEFLSRIARQSHVKILTIEKNRTSSVLIQPTDVYDVASLLVSDLAYLHAHLPNAPPPSPGYDPGPKFPSHVFQRAGILLMQLQELEEQANTHSDWLYRNETTPHP